MTIKTGNKKLTIQFVLWCFTHNLSPWVKDKTNIDKFAQNYYGDTLTKNRTGIILELIDKQFNKDWFFKSILSGDFGEDFKKEVEKLNGK